MDTWLIELIQTPYTQKMNVLLFCIFILLSRESDSGAMFWTNPHSLRRCQFPSLQIGYLTSSQRIWSLFVKHQAEIIIVKPLSKDATTWLGNAMTVWVEPTWCDH